MAFDSVKRITNLVSVNVFDQDDQPQLVRAGNQTVLYWQLWQSDRNQRYIPATGATLSINFPRSYSVGSSSATVPAFDQSFQVNATIPVIGGLSDPSIWQVPLSAVQASLVASGGAQFILTENGVTSTYFMDSVISKLQATGV